MSSDGPAELNGLPSPILAASTPRGNSEQHVSPSIASQTPHAIPIGWHASSRGYPRSSYRHPNGSIHHSDNRNSLDYDPATSFASLQPARPLRPQQRDELDDYVYAADHEQDSDQGLYYSDTVHPDDYPRRSQSMRRNGRPPRSHLNRPWPYRDQEVSPMPSNASFDRSQTTLTKGARDDGTGLSRVSSRSGGGGQKLDWKNLSKEEKVEVMRLPLTHWMHSQMKNHFVATLGEFVGTTLFLLFAFAGTEVANIQSQVNAADPADSNSTTGGATGFDVSVLLYISLIFGFSLMVNVWIFFRISGGLFNPAVTFAMLLVKAVSLTRAVCLFVAQILGSLLASVIVRFLLPERFNVRTTLSGGVTLVQGVFIEAILTAELVFTIIMLANEKHRATFMAPVGIGLALFIAEMVGVQFTGGSLNPARSFGPCVITLTFDDEHWIYWVGPFLGALIAVGFYRFIKTLEYEMANPGADGDPLNDPTQNPEKLAEVKRRRLQV